MFYIHCIKNSIPVLIRTPTTKQSYSPTNLNRILVDNESRFTWPRQYSKAYSVPSSFGVPFHADWKQFPLNAATRRLRPFADLANLSSIRMKTQTFLKNSSDFHPPSSHMIYSSRDGLSLKYVTVVELEKNRWNIWKVTKGERKSEVIFFWQKIKKDTKKNKNKKNKHKKDKKRMDYKVPSKPKDKKDMKNWIEGKRSGNLLLRSHI